MDDIVTLPPKAAPAVSDTAWSGNSLQHRRPPPKAIQCVLPVWGYRFVRQFLEVGLPTLLAPGNVPALAATLPTRFIILSSLDDEDFIRHHPTFRRLCDVCQTEIRLIDHLISENYIAQEEGFRPPIYVTPKGQIFLKERPEIEIPGISRPA